MPAEIGPPISRISRNEEVLAAKRHKNAKNLYRGRYVEPDKISSDEGNTSYKVIYCAASLK